MRDPTTTFPALLLASAAAFGASPAAAADPPALRLEHARWEMISPPADVGGATLAEIFDELPNGPGDYGEAWAVFRTAAPTSAAGNVGYELVPSTGTLEAGEGYWVIQATGADVEVRLPASGGAAASGPGCPAIGGCATAPLKMTDDGRDYLWNLTGLPVAEPLPLARASVVTTGGACGPGCDFAAAEAAGVMHDEMWRYVDRPGEAYEKLTQSDALEPWQAVWVPVLANAAGRSAKLSVGAREPADRPDLANGYTLAFEDEFDAGALDPSKWSTGHIWGPYIRINDERQLYVDALRVHEGAGQDPFVFTDEGTMKIVASKVGGDVVPPARPDADDPVWNFLDYQFNPDYDPAKTQYLSGIITSYEAFRFAHGYAEIRAKVPTGPGLWPAFWLLPSQYVDIVPEIDVMEHLGQNAREVYHTYHFFDRSDPTRDWRARRTDTLKTTGVDFSEQFHTYGVAWEPGQLIYYVDGVEVHRVRDGDPSTAGPNDPIVLPRQAMFLIANLAVGGNWPGLPTAETVFPAEYEIDWIRAWKKDMATPVDLNEYTLAFGDEFDGTTLDESKWNTSFLWGPHLPINCEEQYYVDVRGVDRSSGYSPFRVADGQLTITAAEAGTLTPSNVPTPPPDPLTGNLAANRPGAIQACRGLPVWQQRPGEYDPARYTSGIITSYDAFAFVEGYAEIRAKVPAGDGLWPAFWLLNSYYVHEQPEIDIMEVVGEEPGRVHHSFHRLDRDGTPIRMQSTTYSKVGGSADAGYADDFHTYAVQWKRGEIVWYVDGEVSATYSGDDVAEQLMYVIVNLAVGGNFNSQAVDGTKLPAELVIDHIRVYQQKSSP